MRRRTLRAWIFVATLVAAASGPAGAADTYGSFDETYGDDYQAGDLARLTSAENGVTIVRGHADDGGAPDAGIANTPVFVGDTLRTAADQRVEVQLADGSLVRLDRSGELRVQAFPDPYAEFKDNTVLALVEGTVQIVADVRDGESFRIDTSGATVYLTGSGEFRIDATHDGRTRVYSRQGVAEVAGDGGSVLVRAGQTTEATPGAFPAEARPFNTLQADAFDRWTADLDRVWQARQQPTDRAQGSDAAFDDVPAEVQPYYRELSNNGRWVYVEDYGWSWYPVGVAAGWRPYLDGGWVYGPNGYFWVSSEPWGWAPYHYGRWSHVPTYGWIWSPGRVFAGAWVSWSWGSAYIGWCPLNYWNYPVHYGRTYWGYYGSNCWTFVHHSHFTHRDYHRYAVPVDHIGGDLHGRAVSSRPPRVDPRSVRDDANARREAVRQVSAGRPALDRGLDRRADDTVSGERGRFRDMEDRFVQRGARAERVTALRNGSRRDPAATDRSAGQRGPAGSGGAAAAGTGRGASARNGERASSQRPPDGAGQDVRTRPRQIRAEAGAGDDRVRDMYRRIQRTEVPGRATAAAGERTSTPRDAGNRTSATARERRMTGSSGSSTRATRSATSPVRPQRRDPPTAPSRSSARSQVPSRSARDPGAAVRPAPTRRAPTADRRNGPSGGSNRSASPQRSPGPSRSASPGRSSRGSKSASPGRSSGGSKSASPGRSSGGSKSASPGRSSGSKRSGGGRSGKKDAS